MVLKTQDFFVCVGAALTMDDSPHEISPETTQLIHEQNK
jgi:hypothetical protein